MLGARETPRAHPCRRELFRFEKEGRLNRRQMITTTALGVGGFAVGTGFSAPACPGVSKEKAVKVAGFVIELSKEAVPLLELLGAPQIANLVTEKAIPALEKLKAALEKADIPTSRSTLDTIRSILGGIATGLMNLPESPRRTTIIGILASINVLLLTVEAFVKSEAPESAGDAMKAAAPGQDKNAEAIKRVFEASRT